SWTRPCGAGWRLSHRGSRVDRGSRRWCGEQGACEGHAGGPAGVREESRLADAHEATRQDVLDKATQKLHRGERHGAALIATGVVLVGKCHVLAVEGEEPVIADRDPMGIASEISQDGRRSPEGRL